MNMSMLRHRRIARITCVTGGRITAKRQQFVRKQIEKLNRRWDNPPPIIEISYLFFDSMLVTVIGNCGVMRAHGSNSLNSALAEKRGPGQVYSSLVHRTSHRSADGSSAKFNVVATGFFGKADL
jgi:hypothetical protein